MGAQKSAPSKEWVDKMRKIEELVKVGEEELRQEIEIETLSDDWRRENELKNELRKLERYNVKIGDGVSIKLWTDSEPYTVIARTAKTITIQKDKATRKSSFHPEMVLAGFSARCVNQDEQEYDYARNPNGSIITLHWSERSGAFSYYGNTVYNGRKKFYDYNF